MIENRGPEDRNPEKTFEELTRAAEAEAGVPSDEELYGPMFAEVEADETGRVPSPSPPRDEEGNPVEAPEEEAPEEAPVEPEEELVVEASLPPDYEDLRRKVGQLVNENAELRKMQEQIAQMPQQVDPYQYEQALEADPAQAVALAVQAQNPYQYEQAIRAWYDVDPVAAGRYERQAELAQMQQRITDTIGPQMQTATELAQRTELDAAIREVSARHDDFDQVLGGLDEQRVTSLVESGFPVAMLQGLTGSQKEKEGVLETLYRWQKSEQAAALVPAAVEAQLEQKEQAKERKRAAAVASASTTTAPAAPESEAERQMRVWKEQRPSLRDGWQGRPER